jgi:6-phosphogluconate dehydrogenase
MCTIDTFGGFVSLVGFNLSYEDLVDIKRNNFEVLLLVGVVSCPKVPEYSVEELVSKLKSKKRVVWIMLPTGKITDDMIKEVLPLLKKRDVIVNGANSFYKNAERQERVCRKFEVVFFDCGVSGGTHGLKNGYTLMVGGEKKYFKDIEPICKALAPTKGYGYFGPVGSGHYVKSVHNIVEYVYLEGIAEGVELLDKKNIDLAKAVEVWGPASVVKSWLIDLTAVALRRKDFKRIGTNIGSVTIDELQDTKKSVKGFTPGFDVAVKIRKDKSKKFSLGKRVISAVRNEFGGHTVKKK